MRLGLAFGVRFPASTVVAGAADRLVRHDYRTYTAAVRVWVRGARNGLLVFDMARSADLLKVRARQ